VGDREGGSIGRDRERGGGERDIVSERERGGERERRGDKYIERRGRDR
jgi:hypothetical protein